MPLTAEQLARTVHAAMRDLTDRLPVDWELLPVRSWEELTPEQAAWCQRIGSAVWSAVWSAVLSDVQRELLMIGRIDSTATVSEIGRSITTGL